MKKIHWADVFAVVFTIAFFGWPLLFIIAPVTSNVYNHFQKECNYEQIAYQTTKQNDPSRLISDGEKTVTNGIYGRKEVCKNGNGTLLSENITVSPVDQVVSVPTKQPEPIRIAPMVQYTEDYSECPITTCNDGWCSESTGQGTCSSHGGIASYNF